MLIQENGELEHRHLSWEYYCYVKKHLIDKWNIPTAIIYGTKDNLQNRATIDSFAKKFNL